MTAKYNEQRKVFGCFLGSHNLSIKKKLIQEQICFPILVSSFTCIHTFFYLFIYFFFQIFN